MSALLNYHDYRAAAKRRLPRGIFEYIDRGAGNETAIAHNRAVLDSIRIEPRMLNGSATRSHVTRLFGQTLSMPLVVAPTAMAGLVCHNGEIAVARAAARSGIAFCSATEAINSVEEIVDGAGGNVWLQVYVWKQIEHTLALLDRAWRKGVTTLLVTVDTPVYPVREYNVRNGFGMPLKPTVRNAVDVLTHPRWLAGVLARYYLEGRPPRFANYPLPYRRALLERPGRPKLPIDDALSWESLAVLRRHWKGAMIIKGILHVDDARAAADRGMDGIVVSNHGARNLDCAIAPAQLLPRIADAVGERLTVLADSGVQRGSDIFKLQALGAKAVLAGRAFLNAAAVGGEDGVHHMASLLADEFARTVALAGPANRANVHSMIC
jgi:(S)-mandelate dehydrogenase